MIGGLFSFLISILLLVYFGLCINKLITGEDNLKFTQFQTLDLDELGDVSYKQDTDLVLYAIIRKDGFGAQTPYINGSGNFS